MGVGVGVGEGEGGGEGGGESEDDCWLHLSKSRVLPLVPLQGRVERSWLSLDAEAMRPSVELHVDEEKAEASGVCLGLESLTKKGEFSSVMARNCTVTAIEDSFLLQFALEATNSVLVRDTSHPCPSP